MVVIKVSNGKIDLQGHSRVINEHKRFRKW